LIEGLVFSLEESPYRRNAGEVKGCVQSDGNALMHIKVADAPRMPSAVRWRSCGSVRVAWLDREQALREVKQAARNLVARDPRVLAVGLFGSLARGDAGAWRDADVLILLREHPMHRWFDRIPEYLEAFASVSLPVDVFPYTCAEARRLAQPGGFLYHVLGELMHLAGEPGVWPQLRDVQDTC